VGHGRRLGSLTVRLCGDGGPALPALLPVPISSRLTVRSVASYPLADLICVAAW
jgi:hypothetical protein